jgi:poly(hydroxyalkanoate) granule-associated protein
MLKQAKSGAGPKAVDQAVDMSQSVLNSSHQIWLAGLGAFSRAQQEGMKLFEALVRQGESLERTTRRAAVETAEAARGAAKAKAKEMQQMAGGTWDKLEQVFEDRVERALSKLGVYTQNDVQRLADRVDELSEAVNALLKATGVKPAAAARKPAKKAAKKAARKTPPKPAKKTPPKPAKKSAAKAAPKAPSA